MVQEFYINSGSVLPYLRMELIKDGRYSFNKIHNALQDATITFTMRNSETGLLKISEAPCELLLANDDDCGEKYIIQYKWKEKDTKYKGIFDGKFRIHFNGNITEDGVNYPDEGDLIMPILEDLKIYIR